MGLLYFIIINYAMSNIVVHSSLFENTRLLFLKISPNFFGKLITCFICYPTWNGFFLSTIGLIFGFSILTPSLGFGIDIILISIFLDGMFASGSAWLIHTVQEWFERIGG